jgi:hypothetical protein
MAADAILFELGVRQSAARIPFKGVAQRDTIRNFDTDENCAEKLRICANQVNPEPHYLKNRNNMMFDF